MLQSQHFGIPDVAALTSLFFILYFLAATQDIAVDGWALTMLKPSNVGYAATCNSVGQQIGWLMGFVVFTALGEDKDKLSRSEPSLQSFFELKQIN